MAIRKLDGHKLMMIARLPRGPERFVRDRVISSAARNIIGAATHRSATGDVQTKFQTARTETRSPIKRSLRPEIVPLQRHAEPVEIAPELAPALGHGAPGDGFVVANHRAKFTGGEEANASEVSPR